MSFSDENSGHLKKILGGLGALAIALVIGGLVRGGTGAALDEYNTSSFGVENRLDELAENDPSFALLYGALKSNYPEDHARFVSRMSSLLKAGATQEEIGRESFGFMRQFMNERRQQFAAAPPAKIAEVRDKNIQLVRHLHDTSKELCAQFVMDGFQPGVRLSPASMQLVAEAAVSAIEAAASGRDTGNAPVAAATEQDWEALLMAMTDRGVSEQEIGHLVNSTYSSLAPSRQCGLGLALYEGIADIPSDASTRIAAELLIPPPAS